MDALDNLEALLENRLSKDKGSNMITKAYAVFKEGVYRHECGGIFSTYELAEIAAKELISGEKDNYHSYFVVPFNVDQKTYQDPLCTRYAGAPHEYISGGELVEASGTEIGRKDS